MDDDTTSTCTSRVHRWTDVVWWDQVKGVFGEASSLPHPLYFPLRCTPPSPASAPSLLGLSSELHVAWLPTASCDKPSCPLTTSFLMLAGKTPVMAACVCVCTHTRAHAGFKRTSSNKKKSFQMTKHRLLDECLLRLFFVVALYSISEVRHCICVYLSFSVVLLLWIDIYMSDHFGCCFSVCLRSISMDFFLPLSFPPCFTFFKLKPLSLCLSLHPF